MKKLFFVLFLVGFLFGCSGIIPDPEATARKEALDYTIKNINPELEKIGEKKIGEKRVDEIPPFSIIKAFTIGTKLMKQSQDNQEKVQQKIMDDAGALLRKAIRKGMEINEQGKGAGCDDAKNIDAKENVETKPH